MVPSVYFGFFCFQVFSVSNFCPDKGVEVVTYLGSLVQLCCGEGGALQTNLTGMCEECSQCLGHTGFAPAHGVCAFQVYTAQAPGCSAGELSKAGPGLRALSRPKLLRFRFSGTPQRRRAGGACVLCPSQVWAAQATRCLVSALSPGGWCVLSPPWAHRCTAGALSQECRVSPLGSWSLAVTLLADVNRPGPQEDLVSNWEPAHSWVEDAISGAKFAPRWLWLSPTCLSASGRRWAGPQPASSPLVITQSFVLWAGPAVP